MKKLRSFVALTLLGGLTVVLPIAILIFLFQWLFGVVTHFIQPFSDLLISRADMREAVAQLLVVLIMLAGCFGIGLLIKTRLGSWFHRLIDAVLSRFAPGYSTIRDLVLSLLGRNGEASLLNGKVALVKLYANSDIQATAIVTSEHELGYTVYVPTAPVPSSGMVYHVPKEAVVLRPDITVEQAMKTVVACGSGSNQFFNAEQQAQP